MSRCWITPKRSVYFNSLALSKRYLSIARRMSSATGAPVFSDSLRSFLSCSFFKKRAVRFIRFITIKYHTGIHVPIGRQF